MTVAAHFKYALNFLILFFCISCASDEPQISFYHWKADAHMGPVSERQMAKVECDRIYMHYFDVVRAKKPNRQNDGIFPTYVLGEVDSAFSNVEIVPVIFISNEVFEKKEDHYYNSDSRLRLASLAQRLVRLIDQISTAHCHNLIDEVQIDCDWTGGTKEAYFTFLEEFSQFYSVSATIRLHQVKYAERTGVPPVAYGALMLYNMGDLNNMSANSIIDADVVETYLSEKTSYPLSLDVALPLFSQTVIQNNELEVRLASHCDPVFLSGDAHFSKIEENLFEVVRDTTYGGFFLYKGYLLKTEESSSSDIVSSYQVVKDSQLQLRNIVFYHLDEDERSSEVLSKVVSQL